MVIDTHPASCRRNIDAVWQAFRDYLESPTSDAGDSLAVLTDRLRDVKVSQLLRWHHTSDYTCVPEQLL